MVSEGTTRQWRKSIYLDHDSYQAFLFLKAKPASEGFRFSPPSRRSIPPTSGPSAQKAKSMLKASGWKRRRESG